MRYFIKMAYDGTPFHGWQIQPNATSVQEVLNQALSVLLQTSIQVMGAGRTDTGVHAKQMYAHFDCENSFDIQKTIHKLNAFLPAAVMVFDILKMPSKAHARFDAQRRSYEYHIHSQKNPFLENKSWFVKQKLDVVLMNEASSLLLNHTNFQCFSKVNTDVNTFDCTIFEAYWKKDDHQLVFYISANRFLRNMVRSIVGTMINVGFGKTNLADFVSIIENKNRSQAGASVPAHGLYLTKIEYDFFN